MFSSCLCICWALFGAVRLISWTRLFFAPWKLPRGQRTDSDTTLSIFTEPVRSDLLLVQPLHRSEASPDSGHRSDISDAKLFKRPCAEERISNCALTCLKFKFQALLLRSQQPALPARPPLRARTRGRESKRSKRQDWRVRSRKVPQLSPL